MIEVNDFATSAKSVESSKAITLKDSTHLFSCLFVFVVVVSGHSYFLQLQPLGT